MPHMREIAVLLANNFSLAVILAIYYSWQMLRIQMRQTPNKKQMIQLISQL